MFDLQANFNMVRCINMIYQTRLHIQSDCTVTSGKASHGGLLVGGYISSPLGARDHNSKEKGLDTVTVSSKTPNYLDRFGKRNNDACRCSLIRSCSKKNLNQITDRMMQEATSLTWIVSEYTYIPNENKTMGLKCDPFHALSSFHVHNRHGPTSTSS